MSRELVILQSPDGLVSLSISILSLAFVDVFLGDDVCDDGFSLPGPVPPGWEHEWEDDSA
jgi:hypothetical protein